MRYLCIETTGSCGFISLFHNQKKEISASWPNSKHSENITLNLKSVLSFLEKINKKIDFIAVDIGPGRFTGLRVGVNVAKTLAYQFHCPILPLHSLRILAHPLLKKASLPILCLMEAFGNEFYVGLYQKNQNAVQVLVPPTALSLEDLEKDIRQEAICISDIDDKKKSLFSKALKKRLHFKEIHRISEKDFSETVLFSWTQENLKDWSKVDPCYLRVQGILKK